MKFKLILFFISFSTFVSAQLKPSQQWLDQKFSMFIHFGLYSEYGGVYEGKPVTKGYSEQIQSFAGIFSDWYGETAQRFNPVQWNADSIVSLAKSAGMKSIVFTSKHHDGFCMYDSKYTDFNIVDTTPYGRDLMKELAEACKRGGIGFSVYFSLIDWHYPQAYPISSHNADPNTPEHYQFNLKQVEEIMTNYGPISEIWFDMGSLIPEQSKGLYDLVNTLQPECMISGRLGNDYIDFAVMADNEYPDYKLAVPWQTAASMFDETWGYRSWQQRGEVGPKVEEKLRSLVKVISRGGNYLLNIGPRGDGSLVEFERDVLLKMGKWISDNSEAIYGSTSNPFDHTFSWGDITTKDNTIFAFIENMPSSKKVLLDGFEGKVDKVSVLATREACDFIQKNEKLEISLPSNLSAVDLPVLKITFKSGFVIKPSPIISSGLFTPENAVSVFGHSSLNYYGGYKSLIAYDWAFRTKRKAVSPKLLFSDNEKGKKLTVAIDGNLEEVELQSTEFNLVKLESNSVKWGNLFKKQGSGVFGFVEEENKSFIDTKANDSDWTKVADFSYGEKLQMPLGMRKSVLFLQEIESTKEQQIAVEIGSGNAVYILLNGKYITAHLSPERIKYEEEIVFLPLRKGDNQLIIKYYNGYEKSLNYSIRPLSEWHIYSISLPSLSLEKADFHTISIRSSNPESKVSPLRMNNIQISF
ncbi:MAG: alpha-L-fucosidase [Dysgonamonadaceae bacterium]|nr:alpha-L-fucosidase [Dysgonamonadaceae bacterium]